MSATVVSDSPPTTLSFYPDELQAEISKSDGATGVLRKTMSAMLEQAQQRSIKELEEFRSHFEGFNFPSPEDRENFFAQLDSLSKIATVSGYIPMTEDELRQVGQHYVDNLPADHLYKMLLASKAQTGYAPVNPVDLSLHLLYSSRVLIPLCNPVAGFVAQIQEENYRYITKIIQNIASFSGREALVPFFHFFEWQAEGSRRLASGVPALQQSLEQKDNEIAELKADLARLKSQSNGSSQFTWEV